MIKSSIESPTYKQCDEPSPRIDLISESGLGFARERSSSSKKTEFFKSNFSKSSLSEYRIDSIPLPDTIAILLRNFFFKESSISCFIKTISLSIKPWSVNFDFFLNSLL